MQSGKTLAVRLLRRNARNISIKKKKYRIITINNKSIKTKTMKKVYLTAIFTLLTFTAFTQTKTIVGIMPFNTTSSGNDNYYNRQNQTQSANIIAIQDAVSDAFLNAKRFTLVEREKMELLR